MKNLLCFGAVSVNGVVSRQFDLPLKVGDQIVVGDLHGAAASNRLQASHVHIVHEDAAMIVVDKPSGLLTVATEDKKTDTLFAPPRVSRRARRLSSRASVRRPSPRSRNLGLGALCQVGRA